MIKKASPGRPERPIDEDSPFAEFAGGLRRLRASAGLTVRDLADRTGYSAAAISAAAGGTSLPSLALTIAFAQSCGQDAGHWVKLWQQVAEANRRKTGSTAGDDVSAADQAPARLFEPYNTPSEGGNSVPGKPPGPGVHSQSTVPAAVHVCGPSGRVIPLPPGDRLVFGRGPDSDLIIRGGRGLSRRAGLISASRDGAWIANVSCTHALYSEGDGYRLRLPRMDEPGEPALGLFVRTGKVFVGSRSMLDEGQSLVVTVADHGNGSDINPRTGSAVPPDEATVLPLYLDPNTKLFLAALLWCRPWLLDPARTIPIPRTPEIARAALEVTDAHHELELFDTDPAFRDTQSARVAEYLKVLRRKLTERGLVRPDIRLSDEVAVSLLIENGAITAADLERITDPAWCSRQEDLWWTRA